MRRGLLSNEKANRIAHTSIAMNAVQERRDIVGVPNGLKLQQYANVYFDSHNPMLSVRRDQNDNICILKFDRSSLDSAGGGAPDSPATRGYAGSCSPIDGLKAIDFRLVCQVLDG